MSGRRIATALVLLALSPPALAKKAPLPPLAAGDRYVAMGSSYAAGLGLGEKTDGPARCGRTLASYGHVLAARLGLSLADATCSSSTTEHVLAPWDELPAQIDSVTPETRLVTLTSGGNDVGFVRNLFAAACATIPQGGRQPQCPTAKPPTEDDWRALEGRLRRIAGEVRRRAPLARLVFIDYPTILPRQGGCAALLGSPADLAASRRDAERLAALTARVARQEGALLLRASRLTAHHGPCDADPWSFGTTAPAGSVPNHPGAKAHAAIAEALTVMLKRTR